MSVDNNLCIEERRTVFCLCLVEQDILERDLMFLTPLQQLALEIHFLVSQFVDVDKASHYLLLDEGLAMAVSSVKVDGTDEGFEGIARKIAVVRLVMFVSADEFVETYLCSKSSERFPLHNLASSIRQEAFSLTREVMIDNLAYDSTQDGIAKELEALVVQAVPFFVLGEHRLVHQRFLIDADVARIEAQHFMKNAIKLLILAERQPYSVYQV